MKGQELKNGRKSIAYSLTFSVNDRTLTDEEINPLLDKIVEGASIKFDAKLRE